MITYVLDACAFIAFLRKENGHESIKSLLIDASLFKCRIFMHSATLAEVYYDFVRAEDKDTADAVLSDIARLPIELVESVSLSLIRLIGHFKTNYKISFADSFVLALGKEKSAIVVTSDHHEFDEIEKSTDIVFKWIR